MPRNISANLSARITDGETTLTECLLVTKRDGLQIGFTKLNADVVFEGITYRAAPAMDLTNVGIEAGLNVDESQLRAAFVEGFATKAQLRGRQFEDAAFVRFFIDWQHPDDGPVIVQKGRIGRIPEADNTFSAELHSLSALAQRPIGDICSPTCRHKRLGDSGCQLEMTKTHPTLMTALRVIGLTVTAVIDAQTFRCSSDGLPDDYFTDGIIYWTSGDNNGLEQDVLSHTNYGSIAEIVLQEPMPSAISVDDVFTGEWGCDRTLAACQSVNNVVNRDAEDYLPGRSKVLEAGV